MVVWEDHYSIGNEDVDRQHQHIMALINAVEVAATSGEGSDNMDLVLKHLIEYLNRHFAAEERLMSELAYPELETHRLEHQAFTQTIARVSLDLKRGRLELARTMELLTDWLHWHLLGSDQKYAAFLASNPDAVNRWSTSTEKESAAS